MTKIAGCIPATSGHGLQDGRRNGILDGYNPYSGQKTVYECPIILWMVRPLYNLAATPSVM